MPGGRAEHARETCVRREWKRRRRSRVRRRRRREWRQARPAWVAPRLSSDLHFRFEKRRPQTATCGSQALGEFWADAGGPEHASDLSGFVDALAVEHEQILHGDDVRLHAND